MRCAVCVCTLLAAVTATPAPESYGAPPPPSPAEADAALGGPGPLPGGITPGPAAAGGGRGRYNGRLGSRLGGPGGPLTGGPSRPLGPKRGPLIGPTVGPLGQSLSAGPRRGALIEDAFINQGNPLNLRPDGFVDGPSRPYAFNYEVIEPEFGNNYGHAEESDGVVTQGEYRVLLPDGRTQTVTYTVEGNSGFQAVVRHDGEVRYPLPGAPGGPAGGGFRAPLNGPAGGGLGGPLRGAEALGGLLEAKEPNTSYGI